MTILLPWPPTTNTAYTVARGRLVKTAQARAYAEEVIGACLQLPIEVKRWARAQPIDARFAVTIAAHPPDHRARDLANIEKVALDALFDWLQRDDSQIDDLRIYRMRAAPDRGGFLHVNVAVIGSEP